jgi:hypothetical protein
MLFRSMLFVRLVLYGRDSNMIGDLEYPPLRRSSGYLHDDEDVNPEGSGPVPGRCCIPERTRSSRLQTL